MCQEQTQFISSDTDIKLFINENRTSKELPKEVDLDLLNPNEDFERHQSELLASAIQRQEDQIMAEAMAEQAELAP